MSRDLGRGLDNALLTRLLRVWQIGEANRKDDSHVLLECPVVLRTNHECAIAEFQSRLIISLPILVGMSGYLPRIRAS